MPKSLDVVKNNDGTYRLGGEITDEAARLVVRVTTLGLSTYVEPRGAQYVEPLLTGALQSASGAGALVAAALPNLAGQLAADGQHTIELALASLSLPSPRHLELTLAAQSAEADVVVDLSVIGDV